MRIGLRHYTAGTVDWLKATLGTGDCTRTSLARELCEREDWRNAKGELCLASARAVLPKLSSALGLSLPEARPMGSIDAGSLAPSLDYPDRVLSCSLDDLGEISVVPVADAEKSLARSMMAVAPSRRRCRLSWRAHPLLAPFVRTRHSRRPDCRRRLLAPQGARSPHRLVAGGPGRQYRARCQQRSVPDPSRGSRLRACVAGAGAVPRPRCGRLGGALRCPPGTGLQLRGAGAHGRQLSCGGLDVLQGSGIGQGSGAEAPGVREAAVGGMAGGSRT